MSSEEGDNTKRLLMMGEEIVGNVSGVAIAYIFPGPVGGFAGAATAPLVIAALKEIGTAINNRLFPERALIRAGGAWAIAAQKIKGRLERGETPRTDDFFQNHPSDRAASHEILEGVLLAAQREHQEKKVKFYGNLYANIAFDPSVDRSHANYLIRLLDSLSYRQLCLVAQAQGDRSFPYTQDSPRGDLVNELNELITLGMIKRRSAGPGLKYDFHLSETYGKRIYDLFGLDDIDDNERRATIRDQ